MIKGMWLVLEPPLQYSTFLSRKKNGVQARSLMDCWRSILRWQTMLRAWRTEMGIGQMHVGGGSCFA